MPHAVFAPAVLADVLAWHGHQQAQATALRFLPDRIGCDFSYAQLQQRSMRAAARLWHQWGVRAGDRVAWLGLNHPDQLVLLFALARIGAMLVPLNFRLAPPEWLAVLADCSPRLLLCDAHWEAAARDLPLVVQRVEALTAEPVPTDAPRHDRPEAACLLVYTSGTTGKPRGAVHTQAQLLANMRIAQAGQSLGATDTVATMLPMFHVGGLCLQTLPALYAGAQVLLLPRFEATQALDCLERERPSLTLQVPATLQALISHPRWATADLSSLRAVWAGSSILPRHLIEALHVRGLPVCNVYGATETGPFSIALGPLHAASHIGSCGWPAPEVEVQLQASDGGRDGSGELCLRAPNVIERYWPDLPARDTEGWFHSGDLARQAADGSYTVVGRAKDMVISGGENIYPAEVENALLAHPGVAECAVLGVPDARWGEALVAVVVPRTGQALTLQELNGFLAPQLARYKLPRRLHCVDALPRTALGKVQKDPLRAALQNP